MPRTQVNSPWPKRQSKPRQVAIKLSRSFLEMEGNVPVCPTLRVFASIRFVEV